MRGLRVTKGVSEITFEGVCGELETKNLIRSATREVTCIYHIYK